MKAVLVIDMPNEAKIEEYRITYVVYHPQECRKGVQGVGVSLRPLPSKFSKVDNTPIDDYWQGYNAYRREITGEKE